MKRAMMTYGAQVQRAVSTICVLMESRRVMMGIHAVSTIARRLTPPPGEYNPGACSYDCGAMSTTDPCCSDPLCDQSPICTSQVIIKAEDQGAFPGDIGVKVDLCLDNQNYSVGGVQVDLYEEFDGIPIDCLVCMDCELTERTTLFNCYISERDNGGCRVLLMSTNPGGVISPGLCSIVKIVYSVDENCTYRGCSSLIPRDLFITDYDGFNLTALGLAGEFCVLSDIDDDGILDEDDNCPSIYNPTQADGDGDEFGNVCDNCPTLYNSDQSDYDEDEIGDVCDDCTDTDGDGYGNPGFPRNTCSVDNCPYDANSSQEDMDEDEAGDLCDNCPAYYNPGQEDGDEDEIGDLCDNCPIVANPNQDDGDEDERGDVCDNCPDQYNPNQSDLDEDEIGDACDECTDTDDDGYGNPGFPSNTCSVDNCPYISNPGQENDDTDELGNDCDNCPTIYNPGQEDTRPDLPNNCGDACECEGDLNGDGQVTGADITLYRDDYNRSYYLNEPCAVCIGGSNEGEKCLSDAECPDGDCGQNPTNPCLADLNCDMAVTGADTVLFKVDYNRTPYLNEPCPPCSRTNYPCTYPE